jgi:putative addiction module antidote
VGYYKEAVMVALKLRKVGNSVGVILPQEALADLGVVLGDTLYLTRAPEGCRVTALDPTFERQMKVAEKVMRRDRDMLRELSKQ